MLRALLVLVLVLIAGGVGFYYGRHLHPVEAEDSVPPATEGSRSRSGRHPQAPPGAPPITNNRRSGEATPLAPAPGEAAPLGDHNIGLPIAGLTMADIYDTFHQSRGNGERRHEATDIMAPRGTPVLAVDDGIIAKLFSSKPGGLTLYQFDTRERYCYYYAHLDRYAAGIREGLLVKRGDVIGYVGSTGNASPDAPHLHFAIMELGPEKKWWEGTTPINPYAILIGALRKQISPTP
jgi:murein DD-endopeptidase MepM/ murein hydrolase activator NlpD